ncbi:MULTISPECIES: aromatic-ring-hydroxylating dioxygenase subunit beta [Vibrio]|uniref:Uncharacterized protein n=2 Tax=Vibrio TaxID=662 RepID=A0A7X4LPM7_9VIBR|nr:MULTISPECIES: aromatic-ring-hydroxylating dioxygenase subunit beta [Vibrio]MBF8999041.1 hypothetical protein [Vibrio nitrifigilis]MZI95600.1 hypothetical protein [Vibrio eleionomae]
MSLDMNVELINKVSAFLWAEADMLDHREYQSWLKLWTEKGHYIVPTDRETTDYAATLNLAYDDHAMREMRIARLENGESVSAADATVTVRMVSRVRILDAGSDRILARCATTINELRHGNLITYPADVEFTLVPDGDSFLMEQKVVKLLHAEGYLRTVSFIF